MQFFKGLSPKTVGVSAAVITVLIWTSFIVIARATSDPARGAVLTPFDIVLTRLMGAGLVLIPWGWWLVRRDRALARAAATRGTPASAGLAQQASSFLGLSPLSLQVTATTGVFGGLLYASLAYSGFMFAPAAHASVLLPGSLPLWTTLMAVLMLGDRISAARALGLALIVMGDVLVGGASLLRAFDGGVVWKGDLLFMTAALCWSVYSVLVRRHALNPVRATIAITVFAIFTFVPLYALGVALQLVQSQLHAAPLGAVLFQMLFQGLGSVVISGITFNLMIQYFGPVRSTMMTAVVPGMSALGAAYFLGEPLSWNLWLGLGLVTCGIVFGVQAVKPVTRPEGQAVAT